MDLFKANPRLTVGSRLKRLSDTFVNQVAELYQLLEVDFNPRFFPLLIALRGQEPCSVGELGKLLGISHSAVVQSLNLMKEEGLAQLQSSKDDSRRSDVYLTDRSREVLKKLSPVWVQLEKVIGALVDERAPHFFKSLEAIEEGLSTSSLSERYSQAKSYAEPKIEVIEWDPRYAQCFYDLNEEWISRFFQMEKIDEEILSKPQAIVDGGGMVFFVKYGGLVAGTCALKRLGENHFDLIKMAVSPALQGKGLGKKLLDYVIQWAKKKGARFISLDSARKLTSALKLYEKFGFVETGSQKNLDYARADIHMELEL